jgi:hypothetical protein
MSDQSILANITSLIDEEHALRDSSAATEHKHQRLKHIEEQLDQCWDLLRQRRAKREFGQDPATAEVRDPRTVEGYIG